MRYEYRGPEVGPVRMGRTPRPFDPSLCGSEPGVWQHRRAGEPGCVECKAFYNAKRRARRAA